MIERSIHKGPCADCGLPMVDQREWCRNPRIRPGRARSSGYGRCQACYVRGRRHGTLVRVKVLARYPVECDQCGPVGEASGRTEANRRRVEHLASHGLRPTGPPRLDGADLARLRRTVGLTSDAPPFPDQEAS